MAQISKSVQGHAAEMTKPFLSIVKESDNKFPDLKSSHEQIKGELVLAIGSILEKYGLVVSKFNASTYSDEVLMQLRLSVPDGLNQDALGRDLLSKFDLYGYRPSILGRSFNHVKHGVFVVNGLDDSLGSPKFRACNDERKVVFLSFEQAKSIFPECF